MVMRMSEGGTMGNDANLPVLPEAMQMFAGYPRYEKILQRDCPYLGQPCIRGECKKWIEVKFSAGSPLAITAIRTYTLYQCQDDCIQAACTNLHNIFSKAMMGVQVAQDEGLLRDGGAAGPGSGQGFGPGFGPGPH
jgi:hypothetical protein